MRWNDTNISGPLVVTFVVAEVYLLVPVLLNPIQPPWLVIGMLLCLPVGIISLLTAHPPTQMVAVLHQVVIVILLTNLGAERFVSLSAWYALIAVQGFLRWKWSYAVALAVGLVCALGISVKWAGTVDAQFAQLLGDTTLFMAIMAVGVWHWRQRLDEQEDVRKSREAATMLAQANVKLQEYAIESQKLAIIEERNRLARDIHDTVGHVLTSIILQVNAIVSLMKVNSEQAASRLQVTSETAHQGLEQIRSSISNLTGPTVERPRGRELWYGVAKAFADATSVRVLVDIPEKFDQVSEEVNEIIYRVIQEGLTNAVRHGHATRVEVDIRRRNEFLLIGIHDNGQGIHQVRQGHGLSGMRNRVERVGGEIVWKSQPGVGFHLGIDIPMRGGSVNGEDSYLDCG